ncbi:MAG: glycerol-3-phosphate 1-O-acyltransferase PlsY [Clostridia bacterium]|nr:glycerol-3-phosphate 1-O-acyltransferase PlsY [Clostridia bacterium]
MVALVITSIIAYLIGSISFSVIYTKKFAGFDVREKGSGNAGSTNVLRTAGKGIAILTLICDILKGVVAIAIALLIGVIVKADDRTRAMLVQAAGVLVVIGHTFPVFFNFKGGKGVATSLGVLLMINWKIGLICLTFALIIMAITRIVSVGSIAAAILFPVLCLFLNQNFLVESFHFGYIIFGLIMAVIVIFNHRENVKRIIEGKENKLSFKK